MINLPPADWKHIQAQIAAASKQSMHAGTHFTDLGRMESWVNFSGKEGRQIFHSRQNRNGTRDLRVGRQRSYHCANPSAVAEHFLSSPHNICKDMQLIPITKIFSNGDSINKAREPFLILKGRTIDPYGLNIREETY